MRLALIDGLSMIGRQLGLDGIVYAYISRRNKAELEAWLLVLGRPWAAPLVDTEIVVARRTKGKRRPAADALRSAVEAALESIRHPYAVVEKIAATAVGENTDAPSTPPTVTEVQPPSTLRSFRPSLIVTVALGGGGRSIRYRRLSTPNLRAHDLPFATSLRLYGRAYPFDSIAIPILANIGWELDYTIALGSKSSFVRGESAVTVGTPWHRWRGGLVYRQPRLLVGGNFNINGALGVGQEQLRFSFDAADPRRAESPEVAYTFVRLALGIEWDVGLAEITAGLGYLGIISGGPVADRYLPRASLHGVDAELGVRRRLWRAVAVEVSVQYSVYLYANIPEPEDIYVAEGATDHFIRGFVGLTVLIGD